MPKKYLYYIQDNPASFSPFLPFLPFLVVGFSIIWSFIDLGLMHHAGWIIFHVLRAALHPEWLSDLDPVKSNSTQQQRAWDPETWSAPYSHSDQHVCHDLPLGSSGNSSLRMIGGSKSPMISTHVIRWQNAPAQVYYKHQSTFLNQKQDPYSICIDLYSAFVSIGFFSLCISRLHVVQTHTHIFLYIFILTYFISCSYCHEPTISWPWTRVLANLGWSRAWPRARARAWEGNVEEEGFDGLFGL